MKLYFVSGFLGSGKTTSIINASRLLMKQGIKVGVVTNDQGRYLVDSHFVAAFGIPSVEVSNGCFCCNYDDFDSHILHLSETEKPDIIFAESVGSCADIIATVMKPLMNFRANHNIDSALSAVVDGRLLKARLQKQKLPFSDDVIYIFDKQIEEADLLVINKRDLFSDEDALELVKMAEQKYPEKHILSQTAFDDSQLSVWISFMDNVSGLSVQAPSINMDYEIYTSGELKLAWFDKSFRISSDKDITASVELLFTKLIKSFKELGWSTGHIKLYIKPVNKQAVKLSLTGMDDTAGIDFPVNIGNEAELILNARVETEPMMLESAVGKIFKKIAEEKDLRIDVFGENSFRPGMPRPVHRIG